MARTESFLEERRESLRARGPGDRPVNGIDYISIDPGQKNIVRVHLIFPAPGETGGVPDGAPPLQVGNIDIIGGERIRELYVVGLNASGNILELEVSAVGDFSTYRLQINHSGFDRILREVAFGFRANCQTDFDCSVDAPHDDLGPENRSINYLARDFRSFRQLMLDQMAPSTPDWLDKSMPGIGMTLVELMAHYADHISYAQDAIGTETRFEGRTRTALRRRVKLLGYDVFDGLSARTFVQLQADISGLMRRGDLKFLTRSSAYPSPTITSTDISLNTLQSHNIEVFEPMAAQFEVNPAHNALRLYDWSDPRAVLPIGARQAWVVGAHADVTLKAHDFVLLELLRDPTTKRRADVDPALRQVVRLTRDAQPEIDYIPGNGSNSLELFRLEWGEADALRFDCPIGTLNSGNVPDGGNPAMSMVRGNVILADHGVSLLAGETLPPVISLNDPELAGAVGGLSDLDYGFRFHPVLQEKNISISEEIDFEQDLRPATAFQTLNPAQAVPAIRVRDNAGSTWSPVKSLIDAADSERVFIPEMENDSRVFLRFPTAETGGLEPDTDPNEVLIADYRVGIGARGNIGANTLATVMLDGVTGISGVSNPLPAFGGRDMEAMESIHINAPAALFENKRAVTLEDYARRVEKHEKVERALARRRWHGSWHVVELAVDLSEGARLTTALQRELRDYIEPYRLMGDDVRIVDPDLAPLELDLHICIAPGYLAENVLPAVEAEFSDHTLSNGRLGFFHPDRLSFGDPIYLSHIYEQALSVTGVADAKVVKLSRWRSTDNAALESGILQVDPEEIPILENNRNNQEGGVLTLDVWGRN